MNEAQRKALRAPFPPEQIGHKPKGGQLIDFVGHAAVTDRLLQTDPAWTFTIDAEYPGAGEGYGIRGTMTILGVSRPEYGEGKTPKEAVSDFVKRGAMRFGVALDLWSKEELQQTSGDTTGDGKGVTPPTPTVTDTAGAPSGGHSEPASPAGGADPSGRDVLGAASSSAANGSPADVQPPGPEGDGEGSEGPGAAPCKWCGATEFRRQPTPSGRIARICGACGRAMAPERSLGGDAA